MAHEPLSEPFEIRFELNDQAAGGGDRAALVEFVREQIQTLLSVAELTYRGRPVRVDGFRLVRDPETIEALEHDT